MYAEQWAGPAILRDRRAGGILSTMDDEQGVYRVEVLSMIGALADIDVNVRRILRYLEGEDNEEEEEDLS